MTPAPIPSTEPDSLIDISGVSVQIARKTKINVRCNSVLSVQWLTRFFYEVTVFCNMRADYAPPESNHHLPF
jgi:hypothetical protein